MATEKTINTRVLLRCDELSAWQNVSEANKGGNLVLKKGEVAIALVPQNGSLAQTTPPAAMFKIGDGTNAFKDLPWASALAADVHAWAKAATKPTYSYDEITGTIPVTDTDTQYQLVLNGHTLKLQSKSKNGNWTDVSGQTFNLPDNNTTYTFAEGTTDGTFMVTPSDGPAQSVPVHGVLTSHQSIKTLNTNNTASQTPSASEAIAGSGTINLHKVSKTGSYNDLLDKPTIPNISVTHGNATTPTGDTVTVVGEISASGHTITDTHVVVPTKAYVDARITGSVQYLGTVASANELAALNPDSVGDFCRVSATFGTNPTYHAGDLLLCKTLKTSTAAATWDIVHGEIDKNTWTANSATADGYVTKGQGQANKVWKTDANGVPAWREDANSPDTNQTVKAGTVTFGANAAVNIKAGSNVTVTGNASDNSITITSSYTDTNDNQKVSCKGEGFDKNATVNLTQGSHVTLTKGTNEINIAAAWPKDSDNGYAGINKTGTVTSVGAGVGLKITGTASVNPTVDIDDAIVFILNGGSATTVI